MLVKVRPRRDAAREGASGIDAELLQVPVHLLPCLGELGLEVADFVLHGLKIDFGLERLDVARNVEVEAIVGDLLERRLMGIAFDHRPAAIGVDVLVGQPVLLLPPIRNCGWRR